MLNIALLIFWYFSNSIIKGVFNGEITFDTVEGEGTDFYIKIPVK